MNASLHAVCGHWQRERKQGPGSSTSPVPPAKQLRAVSICAHSTATLSGDDKGTLPEVGSYRGPPEDFDEEAHMQRTCVHLRQHGPSEIVDLADYGLLVRWQRPEDYEERFSEAGANISMPREIWLLGVAHGAHWSEAAARRTIEALRPDVVCLEGCAERNPVLVANALVKAFEQAETTPEERAAMAKRILQAKMRDSVRNVKERGGNPYEALTVLKMPEDYMQGSEMAEAAEAASATGAAVRWVDRPIAITSERQASVSNASASTDLESAATDATTGGWGAVEGYICEQKGREVVRRIQAQVAQLRQDEPMVQGQPIDTLVELFEKEIAFRQNGSESPEDAALRSKAWNTLRDRMTHGRMTRHEFEALSRVGALPACAHLVNDCRARDAPAEQSVLTNERDIVLATVMKHGKRFRGSKRMVACIGIHHLRGVLYELESDRDKHEAMALGGWWFNDSPHAPRGGRK